MLAVVTTCSEPTTQNEQQPTFDDFWTLYPRRVAKKDARRAWDRMTAAQQLAAVVALVGWRRVWLKRGEVEYIPHPATWLNGERWEDELPKEHTISAAAHVQAVLPESGPRLSMPEHVRALLAKLRK